MKTMTASYQYTIVFFIPFYYFFTVEAIQSAAQTAFLQE